ncbi:MAG: diphosphomevalonate decarboxylase, partial [Pseudomonadales bacterium]|nr:diphosphomevalonate decarboxylase [Pseudomonadales bacterium]
MTRLDIQTCANIALIKYWGKEDADRNIPATGSLSAGLTDLVTRTSMEFASTNRIVINGSDCGEAVDRTRRYVDQVCDAFGHRDVSFNIESDNNFPTGAGLASSASGFAALAIGLNQMLDLGLDDEAVAGLARQGSGSAARSIFGGFVEMSAGHDSRASQLAPATHWPLEVVIAITSSAPKSIGSTEGMEMSRASPFYQEWLRSHGKDMDEARTAILERDFTRLAEVSERSCLKMHAVMMTCHPALLYWNGTTVELMHRVRALRDD